MTPPAKRLRVAVLNRNFSPTAGGAERYSMAMVEKLSEKHEIHVFAQSIGHSWPGVTYHRVSMPFGRPRWINQLWFAGMTWWATRVGFDVVHSHENTWHGNVQTVHVLPVKHNLFSDVHGLKRAARFLKVVTSPRLLAYLWLESMRYAVRPGRAVVLISETLRTIFLRSYPDAWAMTSVITPGIELPAFPVDAAARLKARKQLELPEHRPCILFVGNDFRKKGLPALMEVMRLLKDDVVLAVVGDSAQLPVFQEQAVRDGLASRIFFLGALKDVSPAYRAADCLVHPTLEDTFAMVVLEAMAHGLPVAVSSARYCGISGVLTHDANAVILENPADTQALATSVGRLLGDEALKQTLEPAARRFAEQFEWSGIAAMQDSLYESVVNAQRPPAVSERGS